MSTGKIKEILFRIQVNSIAFASNILLKPHFIIVTPLLANNQSVEIVFKEMYKHVKCKVTLIHRGV